MRAYAHGNGCILLPSKVTQTLTFSAPAGQAAVRAADVAAVGAHLTAYWRSPPLPTVAPTRVPTVHSLPPSVVQAEEVHGARRRAAARRALDPGAGAGVPRILARGVPARPPPPPPSRTDWTRLVPPPVLTGHVPGVERPPEVLARPRLGLQCASGPVSGCTRSRCAHAACPISTG